MVLLILVLVLNKVDVWHQGCEVDFVCGIIFSMVDWVCDTVLRFIFVVSKLIRLIVFMVLKLISWLLLYQGRVKMRAHKHILPLNF